MKRQEAIDALVKSVEEHKYGDILDFKEIGYIIHQEYGTHSYNDILQAAKKERAVKKAALEKEKKHHEMMLKLREEKAFIDSLIEEDEGKI